MPQGETGTIINHRGEFIRIKLDFNPKERNSDESFEIEVRTEQITLIDPNILINPELKSYIPPLSADESEKLLDNLRQFGCRSPLVIWEEHSILLDGHNRFSLCTKYGIEYKTVKVRLSSFESAYNWIVLNQLGRRNLTSGAISYLRGTLYNIEKHQGRRNDLTLGQNGTKLEEENLTLDQNDLKLETENLTLDQNGPKLAEENLTLDQNGPKLGEENLTLDQNGPKLAEENLTLDQNGPKLAEENLTYGQNDTKLEEENLTSGQNDTKLAEENLTSGQNDTKLEEENLTSGQNDTKLEEENLTSGQNDTKLAEENLTSGQNDTKLETAERIANEYKVGTSTIKRDAQFALAVDKLAALVGEDVRSSILSRDGKLTKKKTIELANLAEREPDKVKENFVDGNYVYRVPEYKPTPFPYQVGDVVKVTVKNEPQFKGFVGCWAIVTEVSEFWGDVKMWNGTATGIHPRNLSSLEYNPSQRESKKQLCERITRIIEQSPEVTVMQFLSILGKQKCPELTQIESKILTLLEYELGVCQLSTDELYVFLTNRSSREITNPVETLDGTSVVKSSMPRRSSSFQSDNLEKKAESGNNGSKPAKSTDNCPNFPEKADKSDNLEPLTEKTNESLTEPESSHYFSAEPESSDNLEKQAENNDQSDFKAENRDKLANKAENNDKLDQQAENVPESLTESESSHDLKPLALNNDNSDNLEIQPEKSDNLEEKAENNAQSEKQAENSDNLDQQAINSDKLDQKPENNDKSEKQAENSDKLDQQAESSDNLDQKRENSDKLDQKAKNNDKLAKKTEKSDTSEKQVENNPQSEEENQSKPLQFLIKLGKPIDAIPPSNDYQEIIALIDFHMFELGWNVEYAKKFIKARYNVKSRRLLSDEQLIEFLHHLRWLYPPDHYYEECLKYREGEKVIWSGKEYQVTYIRGDLERLVLLSLSGDDHGKRYIVQPFEVSKINN